MLSKLAGYTQFRQNEEMECDIGIGKTYQPISSQCAHCRSKSWGRRLVANAGWALSALLTIALIADWRFSFTDLARCVEKTSFWSPIFKSLDPGAIKYRFNGTLDWPSPYRGPPSPEVDAAWDRITIIRPLDLPFSRIDLLALGTEPDTAARNDPKHGGGYFLLPEFSHQLHCVNLLRKASYFKFEYYAKHEDGFIGDRDMFMVHLDHCVEMLRQVLMCHADIGVVTSHWIDGRSTPWPDFNTQHVCRDFEKVLEWTHKHQLPEGTPLIPTKPAGASVLPAPP